jgi:hypothetical protein
MLNFFADRGKKTNGTGSKCQAGDMAEINGRGGGGRDSSIRPRKVLEVVRVRAGPVVPKTMYNL